MFSPHAIQKLTPMFFHLLWQGALIALLYVVISWMLRKEAASSRYRLGWVALGMVSAAPLITLFFQSTHEAPALVVSFNKMVDPPVQTLRAVVCPLPKWIAFSEPPPENRAEAQSSPPVTPLPTTPSKPDHRRFEFPMRRVIQIWFAGTGLSLLWLVTGALSAWSLSRKSTVITDPRLLEMRDRIQAKFGVMRRVQLCTMNSACGPSLLGWMHPTIILPANILDELLESQVEMILSHEMAHMARHDYLLNVVQRIIESIFFFHPAVWWLSRQMRFERELCCDELVVETSRDRLGYMETLLRLEKMRWRGVTGLGMNGGRLWQRVKRLAAVPKPSGSFARGAIGLSAVAGALLLALFSRALVIPLRSAPLVEEIVNQPNAAPPTVRKALVSVDVMGIDCTVGPGIYLWVEPIPSTNHWFLLRSVEHQFSRGKEVSSRSTQEVLTNSVPDIYVGVTDDHRIAWNIGTQLYFGNWNDAKKIIEPVPDGSKFEVRAQPMVGRLTIDNQKWTTLIEVDWKRKGEIVMRRTFELTLIAQEIVGDNSVPGRTLDVAKIPKPSVIEPFPATSNQPHNGIRFFDQEKFIQMGQSLREYQRTNTTRARTNSVLEDQLPVPPPPAPGPVAPFMIRRSSMDGF